MKKVFSILLAFVMLFSGACMAQNRYPLVLTDQGGRQITIESEPESIVSSYYIATSLMLALGLDERLAGVENQAELRSVYALSAPGVLELPAVGTVKELDIEACAALEPDLVILPLRLAGSAAILESLGMQVLLVNPENQALLEEMIGLIASAANVQEQGEEILDYIRSCESWLLEKTEDVQRPKVYLGGNSSFLSTAGSGMYQSDLIRLAGGANAAAEIGDSYWREISYEQLLAWNPEYIILASASRYSPEDVLNDPSLRGVDAVENGRVYRMPNAIEAWDSPVPGGILGAVWMASVLHPEICSPAECEKWINEYYENFYDFTPAGN